MKQKNEKPQQFNEFEQAASSVRDGSDVNGARTGSKSDAGLTQPCSLKVLASHLARLRPGHPAGPHISNLINQLGNYERNPVLLRPMILMSMQRIEEARPGPMNAEHHSPNGDQNDADA
ncbi:hypothetical protein SAMN05444159_1232 [Bradyrhizobium lablabi]|uniref:Uncharacterized protein n=1 Tax=Bradyrhizobium lablabi TaxID=722472 RepID=A0A1M6LBZ0_9BRAD|nr:hypothetical protein [Bradyrhizobium lablabi]SHJ68693.1 hypothetical protein SAMN05444159_1232 [Bradyrhizobium lablabi]